VLDSIAMNACAHYLNVMLFLLGKTMPEAAHAASVDAIVSRINEIETFDTALLKLNVGETVCRYFVTHACSRNADPVMRFVFERATVEMTETDDESAIRAIFKDGTVVTDSNYLPDDVNELAHKSMDDLQKLFGNDRVMTKKPEYDIFMRTHKRVNTTTTTIKS
jgi:predicted dehydrogenase